MSRIGQHCAAVLLAALLVHPPAAGAQSVEAQARLVDSLAAVGRQAWMRVAQFDDSVRTARLANDTVLAGPLRILVARELEELARRAAPAAADSVLAHAGRASERLGDAFLVVRAIDRSGDDDRVLIRLMNAAGNEGVAYDASATVDDVARGLAEVALRGLAGTIDREFRWWLGTELGWDSLTNLGWTFPRVGLVSMEDPNAGRCYEGNLASCRTLLMADDIDVGSAVGLRESLARVAIQMGGARAYERILLADGTPAARLTAAANAPIDSIIAQWQARIRFARVPSGDMNAGIAAMSAFWIGLFGALSLRSSRWR